MAQTRQRQIKVQVTSAVPSDKVFNGIYADSSYVTLLSASMTYEFKLNAGQTKELYFRYLPKPATLIFKSSETVEYTASCDFGTVAVNSTDVSKTIAIQDGNTEETYTIYSITTDNFGFEISQIKVKGSIKTLPYLYNEKLLLQFRSNIIH